MKLHFAWSRAIKFGCLLNAAFAMLFLTTVAAPASSHRQKPELPQNGALLVCSSADQSKVLEFVVLGEDPVYVLQEDQLTRLELVVDFGRLYGFWQVGDGHRVGIFNPSGNEVHLLEPPVASDGQNLTALRLVCVTRSAS